jgi:hypothetical protein
MSLQVNVGGVWKQQTDKYVNVGGVWKQVTAEYVNVGGVWKQYYGGTGAINLVITANTANYDVFAAAGSPSSIVNVTLTINGGVIVYSSASTSSAIRIVGFAAGSTVTIINNGNIYGAGGNGSLSIGAAGATGGDAIYANMPITIDNTNGYIFGGGGGGMGGGHSNGNWIDYAGGGGGMGMNGGVGNYAYAGGVAGYTASIVAYATSGNTSGAGSGSTTKFYTSGKGAITVYSYGGAGGAWGAAGGAASQSQYTSYFYTYGAGAGGFSIRTNGAGLSITGGNNTNQIKGSYN